MKIKIIIIVSIIIALVAFTLIYIINVADSSADNKDPIGEKTNGVLDDNDANSGDLSEFISGGEAEIDEEAKDRIREMGLSSGNVVYLEGFLDEWGNEQVICMDEKYQYFLDGNGQVSGGALIDRTEEKLKEGQIMTEEQYIALAREYIEKYLPEFDLANTTIECRIDEQQNMLEVAHIKLRDIQGDCLVNTGVLELAKDGTIVLFGGTKNSLKDFEGEYLLENEVKQEILKLLEREYSGEITGDLKYEKMLKEKAGDSIVWNVQVLIENEYRENEEFGNVLHSYILDAKTGDVKGHETFLK